MLIQKLLNQLPEGVSNWITNLFTDQYSIKHWNNRLLGLSSLPIRTIIDVGANEGQSTQKLALIFPEATIYVYEPCQRPFEILGQRFQGCSQIKLFNYALGSQNSTVKFNDYVGATVASSLLCISEEARTNNPVLQRVNQYEVEQVKLDDCPLVLTNEVLIKVDVQGYELEVLKGSQNVLKQAKACIIEINNNVNYQGQCSFKDIFSLLDSFGFTYQGNIAQFSQKSGKVDYFDAVFLK